MAPVVFGFANEIKGMENDDFLHPLLFNHAAVAGYRMVPIGGYPQSKAGVSRLKYCVGVKPYSHE